VVDLSSEQLHGVVGAGFPWRWPVSQGTALDRVFHAAHRSGIWTERARVAEKAGLDAEASALYKTSDRFANLAHFWQDVSSTRWLARGLIKRPRWWR